MSNVVQLRPVPDLSASNPDGAYDGTPLLPGVYTALYVGHKAFKAAGKRLPNPKVRVDFRILEHPLIVLPRWFRVHSVKGFISASRSSAIVRELQVVSGRRIRADRIFLSVLNGMEIKVTVKTVIIDHEQESLAEINQYSVISELLSGMPLPGNLQ